ncbi:MAG: SH3 domain-containing protein [Lawsonibacter sp.]|nr:SH3 domain-containing protein [Lawsonibacter sp.]
MKKTPIHSGLRRTLALTLALLLSLPTAYAAAGDRKLQTSRTLTEGLEYRNTVTVNNDSRVESFSLELQPDSPAYPILLQSSGTIYTGATVNRAVSYAQALGYHVLGAVNTDFFSMTSGVPIGIVIEDGVYKSSAENEDAMLITDGQVSLLEGPKVELTLTNQRDGSQVKPHHLNKWRSATGGLYLLNRDFSTISTHTSTSGWYVRMKLAEPEQEPDFPLNLPPDILQDIQNSGGEETQSSKLTVNSTLTLEVTEMLKSDQYIPIGEDEYILTSDDVSGYSHIYDSFQVGDRITLKTSCESQALSNAQWAGGVGDVMIRNGTITDSSDWTYRKDGRNPRTALGVKADGTLLVYAVDGRQSGYSIGLSQMDLAEELLAQGCTWAVNLDGGGSTAISLWVPGQEGPAVQSSPSEGRLRSCATFLLLVTDDKGDGTPSRLALTEDGQTILTGSSLTLPKAVVLDSGLNRLDASLSDLSISAALGSVEDGIYTAGSKAGTDALQLYSPRLDLEDTVPLHVVDRLTSLTISREGSTAPLSVITSKPGETVQLAVSGSYWGRTALRDWAPVTWSVSGDVGTVDENGLFTISEKGGEGSITATAGGQSHTIQVSASTPHSDVTEDHWAYNAVRYCYEKGIVSGVSATEFGRDLSIRRGDFMLMLYGAMGKPAPASGCDFNDVSKEDYYYTALSWGQEAGLASGTGGGAYSPMAPITREQAFTILRQAMPLLGKDCPDGDLSVLDQFADKDKIADYAKRHAATLVSQGLVSGKGDGIDPQGRLTRAEMAVVLHKLLTFTPTGKPTEPNPPVDPDQPDTQHTLTLDQSALTLASGGSAVLTAALSPAVEGAEITWTSSAPSSAVVSSAGLVTNLFPGTQSTTVTITASWNGLTASCQVICEPARRTGIVTNAETGLNVRTGPGTTHTAVDVLANNTSVVVLDEQEGWYQILYLSKTGQAAVGYVNGQYLTVTPAA